MRTWWVLGLVVLAGCGDKIDPAAASRGFEEIPADQVIVGFKQYMTTAGQDKAIVLGDTAYVYNDSSFVQVKNVDLRMFDEQGKFSAHLTARAGDMNNATNAMIARGNVVLVTKDGTRIETEELHYDPQSHRIWSNVHTVQHTAQGGTLSGSGFDADDKFNNVRVTNARSSGGGLRISF